MLRFSVRNTRHLDIRKFIATYRSAFYSALILIFLVANPVNLQAQEDANARKFRLAESYLRSGQMERATNLLEDLVEADPYSFIYYDRLISAYVNQKQYDLAIKLTEERLDGRQDQGLITELASLHYKKGDLENAALYWRKAVDVAPESAQSYRSVYYSMMGNRAFEDAIAILLEGRSKLSMPGEFRSDLGHLYGMIGDHDKAISEYLNLIVEVPEQISYVKRRLSRMTEQEGVLEKSIPPVEQAIQDNPINRQVRELAAWLYFEGGLYEQAFRTNQAIDILEQENGRTIYVFAKNAMSAEAHDIALKAFEKVLELYPNAPAAANSRFATAELYIKEGYHNKEQAFDASGNRVAAPSFDKAKAVLTEFLQLHLGDPRIPDAIFELAKLDGDIYFRLGESEAKLNEIRTSYPNHAAAQKAAFQLGAIALLKNDLQTARLEFSRLENSLRIGELAESARFQIALIDFYSGQFESASILTRAVDTNTSTDMANDAIELKILLQENRGPDSLDTALTLFASASLLERQRSFSESLDILNRLELEFPDHALSDEVLFKKAEIFRSTGKYQEAIDLFTSLPDLHAKSYLCDTSLMNVAEIYDENLKDNANSLETYSQILDRYPGSLLAPEIRERIRQLRGNGV